MKYFIILYVFQLLVKYTYAQEFSKIEYDNASFTVCKVDLKQTRLAIYRNLPSGQPINNFNNLKLYLNKQNKKLIFAINAGMYHTDYSPVGLYIENEKIYKKLNLNKGKGNFFMKPNGIFSIIDKKGFIIPSTKYNINSNKVTLATQSGPMLVINNKIHPKFLKKSKSKYIRNGVGMSTSTIALFVISEDPINFYHFASFYKNILKCKNALYFDGNVSSLYSSELKRNDFKTNLGPILAITSQN